MSVGSVYVRNTRSRGGVEHARSDDLPLPSICSKVGLGGSARHGGLEPVKGLAPALLRPRLVWPFRESCVSQGQLRPPAQVFEGDDHERFQGYLRIHAVVGGRDDVAELIREAVRVDELLKRNDLTV